MRLTPTERDRLLIHSVAVLAGEALERGLRLSAPEAIAVITDEVQWCARAGGTYADAVQAGATALRQEQVLDGVPDLLDEVRVEALFDEGTRLVVVRRPLGAPDRGVGEIRAATGEVPAVPGRRIHLDTANTSRKIVRVSSHYPFHLVNTRLSFDREAARGFRLDLPAGHFLRWGPGEQRQVTLVSAEPSESSTE